MQTPHIRTTLPGPKAKQLIKSDENYLSPSYTRLYPLAVKRGKGMMIEDVDGNRFLDFTAGIAVCATGHCHPRIVKAIGRQSKKLLHMSGTDFYYAPQRDLARKLTQIAPGKSPKKVFFTNSGAESVEAAFKLARYHTKRHHMIAFFGAFHGRTMGALSLTGSKVTQRKGFEPLIPDVTHVGYGYCYRCPYNLTYGSCGMECVSYIENYIFKKTVAPEEVAAIIVEPIQGEGGYIVPPPEYHRMLKALAEKYGILYIVDEVQTGMGRTGKMFAMEHWGIEPDIICVAKGIASGLPLGAIIARAEIMDWEKGSHASTFGGNPVSCVAALETISLLEEGLIENAAKMGKFLMEELQKMQNRHRWIGEVRGLGLMVGVDLVKDPLTREPATAQRQEILERCFQKGLLLLGCGESAVRFSPPLIVNRKEIEIALEIFDEILTEVEANPLG
ncbi:MAG: acetyl ornithine aminotransferase family protein [Deltaproteobacteria bacterium]|nr:acetyl ornithine aminotransferase family protein [Deltaproteobacteria bacterium]